MCDSRCTKTSSKTGFTLVCYSFTSIIFFFFEKVKQKFSCIFSLLYIYNRHEIKKLYVQPASILYVQSQRNKTELVCFDKIITCNIPIHKLLEVLPEEFYPLPEWIRDFLPLETFSARRTPKKREAKTLPSE